MIRFACPACARVFAVPDRAGGKKSTCPKCGQLLRIPVALLSKRPRRRPVTGCLVALVGLLVCLWCLLPLCGTWPLAVIAIQAYVSAFTNPGGDQRTPAALQDWYKVHPATVWWGSLPPGAWLVVYGVWCGFGAMAGAVAIGGLLWFRKR